ncbi:AraC family transcriptional regulator [Polaribacter sp. MED152]|uniref:helix-turn-helix domain-containing protein n=1 Tax=Polaribacter sp. MED152 TaxID=313598 RepID=UPI000186F46E|nr:helix-turn-helix domain-containing protein [Polaribacter sp. MED152]EAQ42876.2 regulatory helix-turn-helix protein, AraC family [Polaribacter sp. MED152]
MPSFFLSFPDFNLYSTPLLILVFQGLVFVALLLARYFKKKNISDLFLGLILLIICYEQTCYTVGFMGWYNVFRNTKINYFLIPMGVAIAPLIYFYVKAITTSNFTFRKKDWLHFVLAFSLILFRLTIYFYDSLQPGFDETQNGILKLSLDEPIIQPILIFVSFAQMLLYLAFTFQLFYNYRKRIREYFSNTYKLELNWILSFLIAFTLLFLYSSLQDIVGSLIIELNYTQRWWLNIFMALVVLFVGIKGYFTDTTKLNKLSFSFSPNPESIPQQKNNSSEFLESDLEKVSTFMNREKPYLNPDLNLSDLSKSLNLTRAELSKIINTGFGKNFNDFINEYRVNTFKAKLKSGEHQQLSLLGIAYDCGFNSKATFNRVFKKITQSSPTEFLNTLKS